jgi:hypothetical protein
MRPPSERVFQPPARRLGSGGRMGPVRPHRGISARQLGTRPGGADRLHDQGDRLTSDQDVLECEGGGLWENGGQRQVRTPVGTFEVWTSVNFSLYAAAPRKVRENPSGHRRVAFAAPGPHLKGLSGRVVVVNRSRSGVRRDGAVAPSSRPRPGSHFSAARISPQCPPPPELP